MLKCLINRSITSLPTPCPYRHPLFPLLALLFEKCEQATQGSECITSASFDVDIENFVHQQEQDHKPFFSEDPELDNLVSLYLVTHPLSVHTFSRSSKHTYMETHTCTHKHKHAYFHSLATLFLSFLQCHCYKRLLCTCCTNSPSKQS